MSNNKTCCFTGYRPQKLPFGFDEDDIRCKMLKQILRKDIIHMIEDFGVTHFISGMALGVDTFAAEIVLEMKAKYPQVQLECAIPHETQSKHWPELSRNRFFDLVSRCDTETLLQTQYTTDCHQRRNRYMVDQSDYVIAVWDGQAGGTESTVRYARKCKKNVLVINPRELTKTKAYA